jgi:hypothetical protein
MNTKSFSIGFAVVDSIITSISAAKRGITNAAKGSVQATKNGAVTTSDVVTSFFAGASQAVKCHRGSCRMLANNVLSNEE